MDLRSRRVEQAVLSEPGPECLEVFETVAAFYAFIFLYFFFYPALSLLSKTLSGVDDYF